MIGHYTHSKFFFLELEMKTFIIILLLFSVEKIFHKNLFRHRGWLSILRGCCLILLHFLFTFSFPEKTYYQNLLLIIIRPYPNTGSFRGPYGSRIFYDNDLPLRKFSPQSKPSWTLSVCLNIIFRS